MKIFTITMLEKLEKTKCGKNDICDFGDTRLVGYYQHREMAFDSVRSNVCDIRECLYSYAVVEEIKEGLYNPAGKGARWWFAYNENDKKFHEIEEPEWMAHYCGFFIG